VTRQIDTPPSARRTVRLAELPDELTDVASTPDRRRQPVSGGAHRAARPHALPTSRDDWLVLAERAVGDWAATLRAALLLFLAVAAVIMVIGIVAGVGPASAAAFLFLLLFLAGRRRGRR
jgi:hypothetical protein